MRWCRGHPKHTPEGLGQGSTRREKGDGAVGWIKARTRQKGYGYTFSVLLVVKSISPSEVRHDAESFKLQRDSNPSSLIGLNLSYGCLNRRRARLVYCTKKFQIARSRSYNHPLREQLGTPARACHKTRGHMGPTGHTPQPITETTWRHGFRRQPFNRCGPFERQAL